MTLKAAKDPVRHRMIPDRVCFGMHSGDGMRPVSRFSRRDPVGLRESAVSIADAGIRSETCLVQGERWAAAQTCAGANGAPATKARSFAP